MSSAAAAIDDCGVLVLILSSSSNSSHQILSEVARATSRRKHIAVLRIEDVPPAKELELFIGGIVHWCDAVNASLEEALLTFVQNIRNTIDPQRSCVRPRATGVACEESVSCRLDQATKDEQQERTKYDVFISYRRNNDAQTARLIRGELYRRDLRVFLDVDDLRPGHFDEALLERIRGAPNFLVILSPGSLDRCVNLDDWLRREIVCAFKERKKVLPIMMPGFSFPAEADLPLDLRPIRVHHAVHYSHDFFDAMMEKIVDYLGKPSRD